MNELTIKEIEYGIRDRIFGGARRDGVRGWIRLPDGSVEAVYVEARDGEEYGELRARVLAAAEEELGFATELAKLLNRHRLALWPIQDFVALTEAKAPQRVEVRDTHDKGMWSVESFPDD